MLKRYDIPHLISLERVQEQQEASRRNLAELATLQVKVAGDIAARTATDPGAPTIQPINGRESSNPLRPSTLDQMIGQERLKPLLRRLVDASRLTDRPLDHMLFVGASGTGKTTVAMIIANEIGARVFALKAPVDMATLEALRTSVQPRDVVFIDEIHMQVSGDRRGLTRACDPEAFYQLLEDGMLSTPTGPQPFPRVTWIGATTDVGLLPEPLSMRFPIQPRLAPYSGANMRAIAVMNAAALMLRCAPEVAGLFSDASRGVPRQINSYMRAALQLSVDHYVSAELAREVVEDLCSTTLDGLTESMQVVLRFLYRNCRRVVKGEVVYSASVNLLATAAGHGRDTKAIALLVEPYLIQRGLLEVRPSGRTLSAAGVIRAQQLPPL